MPEFSGTQNSPSTLPTLFTSTQIPAQQYGVSWVHVFNPTTSMQVQYGRTHVEDDTLTQFNNHNLWQTYGCSVDMCNSFVGGAAVLVTQTVTGGFSGGEVNSPSSNLSSIHEWSGSVMKAIGNHQIQAGGGWDEVNYTAELRQGTVTFSGASTANFNYNRQPRRFARCPGVQCSALHGQSTQRAVRFRSGRFPARLSQLGEQAQRSSLGAAGRYRQRLCAGQLEDDSQPDGKLWRSL